MGLTATTAGVLVSCSRTGGGPYWRFFSAAEARTANAICEQIIPANNYAGASQAWGFMQKDFQMRAAYATRQLEDRYRDRAQSTA